MKSPLTVVSRFVNGCSLCRQRSQMKQNVQVDHTIIENPTYGALPGGGGRELGQVCQHIGNSMS
jgi:hypothetical protein